MYKYGNYLTPGLTEVRPYATFFASFPGRGLRGALSGIPAFKTSQWGPSLHATTVVGPLLVVGLKIQV